MVQSTIFNKLSKDEISEISEDLLDKIIDIEIRIYLMLQLNMLNEFHKKELILYADSQNENGLLYLALKIYNHIDPHNECIEIAFKIAKINLSLRRIDEADFIISKWVIDKDNVMFPHFLSLKGEVLIKQGEWESARTIFKECLDNNYLSEDIKYSSFIITALMWLSIRKIDHAETLSYLSILERKSSISTLHEIYYLRAISKLPQNFPHKIKTLQKLKKGALLSKSLELQELEAEFENSIQIQYMYKKNMPLVKKHGMRALILATKLMNIEMIDHVKRVIAATSYIKQNFSDCISKFHEISYRHTGEQFSISDYNMLGFSYLQLGEYEKASYYYQFVISMDESKIPIMLNVWIFYAMNLICREEYAKAVKILHKIKPVAKVNKIINRSKEIELLLFALEGGAVNRNIVKSKFSGDFGMLFNISIYFKLISYASLNDIDSVKYLFNEVEIAVETNFERRIADAINIIYSYSIGKPLVAYWQLLQFEQKFDGMYPWIYIITFKHVVENNMVVGGIRRRLKRTIELMYGIYNKKVVDESFNDLPIFSLTYFLVGILKIKNKQNISEIGLLDGFTSNIQQQESLINRFEVLGHNFSDEVAVKKDTSKLLYIKCFGKFKISYKGSEVKLSTSQKFLFVFLLLHYQRKIVHIPRSVIIEALYTAFPENLKKENIRLNSAIYRLRSKLSHIPEISIIANIDNILLKIDKPYYLDINSYCNRIEEIKSQSSIEGKNKLKMEIAFSIYQGAFCSDIQAIWIEGFRSRMLIMQLKLVEQMVAQYDMNDGLRLISRMIDLHPEVIEFKEIRDSYLKN